MPSEQFLLVLNTLSLSPFKIQEHFACCNLFARKGHIPAETSHHLPSWKILFSLLQVNLQTLASTSQFFWLSISRYVQLFFRKNMYVLPELPRWCFLTYFVYMHFSVRLRKISIKTCEGRNVYARRCGKLKWSWGRTRCMTVCVYIVKP